MINLIKIRSFDPFTNLLLATVGEWIEGFNFN